MHVIRPDFIVKSLSNVEDAKSLCSGRLLLRHYQYYSNSENKHKYGAEFERTEETKNSELLNDALIFCTHKKINQQGGLPNKVYVQITNPCELYREIGSILRSISHSLGSYFAPVQYEEHSFLASPLYDSCIPTTRVEDSLKLAFSKPKDFSKENEIRMCFFYDQEKFPKNLNMKNCNLKLFRKNFRGDRNSILYNCLETWLREKSNKSIDYGRDFWVEAELQVDKKYFKILE